MPHIRFLAALLAICFAVGCKAQSTPPQTASQSPQELAVLTRHIQNMIRSQFNIPPYYSVSIGVRKPSKIAGYDSLPVVFSHGSNETNEEFLISTDNKTLARLEKFDLVNDPLFSIDVAGRPIRGNPEAKVTVISFDDLECPFCAQMHQTLFPGHAGALQGQGALHLQGLPAPTEMHPWAMRAAVDANCLAAQSTDAYWHTSITSTPTDRRSAATDHNSGQELRRSEPHRPPASHTGQTRRQRGWTPAWPIRMNPRCAPRMKEAETLRIEGVPALFVDGERINGALPAGTGLDGD